VARNPLVKAHIHNLSVLALSQARATEAVTYVAGLSSDARAHFLKLADAHHVVLRTLEPLEQAATAAGAADVAQFARTALSEEHARIAKALKFLNEISRELESAGCPVAVMKTLDHWPDFGNDLDLITTADECRVQNILLDKLNGRPLTRTVGDHLAHKRSFALEGLQQEVEIHIGRLGQAGEHIELAHRVLDRRVPVEFNGYTFLSPAPEERIIVGTLQRMYRHLYFRICDILNTARMIESGWVDYKELRAAADLGGIWDGVATYLQITSEYLREYRGTGLDLPKEVLGSARFGTDKMFTGDKFLSIPVLPQGFALYASQFARLARSGNVPATARLSLLPPLATVAALAYAVAGSSDRIW
jgi:Uncharacterised nucleotidyltransferase